LNFEIDRNVPRKPHLVGGVKGHNMNEISFARILLATACPGSPALWAGELQIWDLFCISRLGFRISARWNRAQGGESMQVILLENVPSLGKAGDLVKVSDGYGRNYLIPKKKALLATEKSLKVIEHQKRQVQQRLEKGKKDAEKLGQQIEKLSCTFAKTVGESGKLFGSVTSMDIENYLKENGIEVDRKKISLEEPIKNLGMFTVPIKLSAEVTAQLKVWVVQE